MGNQCIMCGELRKDLTNSNNKCTSEEKNNNKPKRDIITDIVIKPKKKASITITNNGIPKNEILDKPKKKIITSSKRKSNATDNTNEPNTWSCKKCTFVNIMQYKKCQICDTAIPSTKKRSSNKTTLTDNTSSKDEKDDLVAVDDAFLKAIHALEKK